MKKVWIDTDPGVDDTFAIAMVFEAADQIEVVGVSTVFGNVDVDQTTRNTKILLEAAGKNEMMISKGAYSPLYVPLETSPFVHGDNGMGNMPLPEPKMVEADDRAPQAIIDVILSNPHEITLLLIGPLTNAAMALTLEPLIAELVKEVVIMGGAVRCPGNITPAAEANFFHDPHAAQIVICAGWPIYLAPLDVCAHGMIPQTLLDRICNADKGLTPYIAGALPFFQNFLKHFNIYNGADFPDALASAYLLSPDIFTIEILPLYIEAEGACMGQSLPVPTGKWYEDLHDIRIFSANRSISPVNVMFEVDQRKFLELIEELLT